MRKVEKTIPEKIVPVRYDLPGRCKKKLKRLRLYLEETLDKDVTLQEALIHMIDNADVPELTALPSNR